MADNFPKLIKLRDLACTQIKIILRFAKAINAETNFESITVRRDLLETRYRTFSELEHQLFDDPNYVSISETVDEIYCEAQGLLTQACAGYDREEQTNPHNLNGTLEKFVEQQKTFYEGVNNTSHHVRLPKVNIEQFSGDYKNWASFQDLYKTTVHDNRNITNVHKLQILKGLLSGEAAALIRHIPVTENNYAEAWDKICNRYKKMTPILTSLIKTFFDQKPCSQANARELRRVTESSDEIIRGLRALGPDAETRDPWLTHIVLSKIDSETKQLWANESVGKDFPKFDTLLNFLNTRCDALEICDATTKASTKSNTKSFIANSNPSFECLACNQPHPLFKCPIFKNNSVSNRIKYVNEKNICGNCLKKGHSNVKCFSRFSCMICRGRHHTLLHLHSDETETHAKPSQATSHHISLSEPTQDKPPEAIQTVVSSPEVKPNVSTQSVFHALYTSPTTVLPTAVVHVQLRTGELQLIRALLDSGSQTSFVTESCAQRLGLKRSPSSISIFGLASSSAGKTREKIDMTIQSRVDNHYTLKVQAHIINNITNMLPTKQINLQTPIVGLELADPQFFIPNKIDILLGADVFFEILKPEKRVMDRFPILQASKFGWLIAGTWTNDAECINLRATTDTLIKTNPDDGHQLLTKCWEVEEVAAPAKPVVSNNTCELYHDKTTTRDTDVQLIVKLLFRGTRASSDRSFEAAHQQLRAMERKFLNAPDVCNEYKSFMNGYTALRHATHILRGENQQEWPKSSEIRTHTDATVLKGRLKYTTGLTGAFNEGITVLLLLTNFPSRVKIRKIMVYILRIEIPKRRKIQQNHNNCIIPAEMSAAEIIIRRNIQKVKFHNEISILNKACLIPATNQLSSRDPFIDSDGLLRVGERLSKSTLKYSARHPVILSKNHEICELIARDIHFNNIHAGNALKLSIVRNQYWMIGARNTIKKLTRCCTVCIRNRSKKPEQKMADLPAVIYIQSRPFIKAELNFADDAIYSKDSFDTASLMTALIRCISRRRTPEEIWCGITSKLIIANRKRQRQRLKTQMPNQSRNTLIFVFSLQKTLIFHFSPPHIDICKMNYSSDLEVLTPACFTVRKSITTIREPKLAEVTLNQVPYWPTIQQRFQSSLKQTSRKATINAVIGVLIRQVNLYTSQWMTGRIKNVHSISGVIRITILNSAKRSLTIQ